MFLSTEWFYLLIVNVSDNEVHMGTKMFLDTYNNILIPYSEYIMEKRLRFYALGSRFLYIRIWHIQSGTYVTTPWTINPGGFLNLR